MVMIKKEYIVPKINVTRVEVEAVLGTVSDPDAGSDIEFSKQHDSFYDDYWLLDEEEKPMFQQPKSLWD